MLRGKGCQSNGGRGNLGRAALMRISSDHLAACINNTRSRSASGISSNLHQPLVRVPGMFLQHGFYLLDTLGVLLAHDFVGNDS